MFVYIVFAKVLLIFKKNLVATYGIIINCWTFAFSWQYLVNWCYSKTDMSIQTTQLGLNDSNEKVILVAVTLVTDSLKLQAGKFNW